MFGRGVSNAREMPLTWRQGRRRGHDAWGALWIGVAFAVAFASLRSSNLLAQDGDYRSLEVWHRRALFFQENRHMLYPANVFLWTRFAGFLGFPLKGPFQFFAAVTLMNALAGAFSLVFFYLLLNQATHSRVVSLAGTVALGLTYCFAGAAANGNEPMMGFAWAILATYVAAQLVRSRAAAPYFLLPGAIYALSMATYRASALAAPAALALLWMSYKKGRVWATTALASGGLIASAAIYIPVCTLEGIRPAAMLAAFVSEPGTRGFLGVSIGKLLAVPLGITNSIMPIALYFPFQGWRGVLRGGLGPIIVLGIFPIVFLAALLLSLWLPIAWWDRLTSAERAGLVACAAGIATSLPVAVLMDPTYYKLMMVPVACLVFALAIGLGAALRFGRTKVRYLAAGFVVLVSVTTLPWLVKEHLQGTPDLPEVARLAQIVKPRDLVVGGWGPVSTLYSAIDVDAQPPPQDRFRTAQEVNSQFFSFPTEAQVYGLGAVRRLGAAIKYTEARGGRIYFVNILDYSQARWNADLLGRTFGVPYSSLARYRSQSSVVLKLGPSPSPVPVRVLGNVPRGRLP